MLDPGPADSLSLAVREFVDVLAANTVADGGGRRKGGIPK